MSVTIRDANPAEIREHLDDYRLALEKDPILLESFRDLGSLVRRVKTLDFACGHLPALVS